MFLKSQRSMGGTGSGSGVPEVPALTRSVSLEGLPTSETQADIQMMSHTLTIKEVSWKLMEDEAIHAVFHICAHHPGYFS